MLCENEVMEICRRGPQRSALQPDPGGGKKSIHKEIPSARRLVVKFQFRKTKNGG